MTKKTEVKYETWLKPHIDSSMVQVDHWKNVDHFAIASQIE